MRPSQLRSAKMHYWQLSNTLRKTLDQLLFSFGRWWNHHLPTVGKSALRYVAIQVQRLERNTKDSAGALLPQLSMELKWLTQFRQLPSPELRRFLPSFYLTL